MCPGDRVIRFQGSNMSLLNQYMKSVHLYFNKFPVRPDKLSCAVFCLILHQIFGGRTAPGLAQLSCFDQHLQVIYRRS